MAQQLAIDEHVFLSGRPPLGEYLGFLTLQSTFGQQADLRALADEWRIANDRVRELETREAGLADNPHVSPLSQALAPLAEQLLVDPIVQRSFAIVPISIGLVELDRLVVYQKHINLAHVQNLQNALGPTPTEEEIFHLCLSTGAALPPVQVMQIAANAYTFVSPSNDLRFLESVGLQDGQLVGYQSGGTVSGVIGLVVGFGANLLNAILIENRLILNNGSHRAYALKALGITHVPCVIQHVTRREELAVMGPQEVQQQPDLYLAHPRPPLLKDYFDPHLRKLVPVPRRGRQVRVTFAIEQVDAPSN